VYCNRSCLWVCDSGRVGGVRALLQLAFTQCLRLSERFFIDVDIDIRGQYPCDVYECWYVFVSATNILKSLLQKMVIRCSFGNEKGLSFLVSDSYTNVSSLLFHFCRFFHTPCPQKRKPNVCYNFKNCSQISIKFVWHSLL